MNIGNKASTQFKTILVISLTHINYVKFESYYTTKTRCVIFGLDTTLEIITFEQKCRLIKGKIPQYMGKS